MTREEAIKVIRKMLACTDLSVRANLTADMVDACHMAIKALEQEPTTKIEESNFSQDQYLADIQSAYDCGYEQAKNDLGVDLISRADAIKAMQDKAKKLTNEDTINGLCGAVAILFEMPSVTPQPRWIPVSERLPDTDDKVLCWYEYYHWSQEKVLPEYGFGGYFKETKAWFGEVANGKDVRVIAWMPLPKSYSEVEE